MDFLDAVKLAGKNGHLIGKTYKGSRIDEIIVYPTDSNEFSEFGRQYILLNSAQKAIALFMNSDVRVGIVADKHRIRTQSVFFTTDISNLTDLGAVLE